MTTTVAIATHVAMPNTDEPIPDTQPRPGPQDIHREYLGDGVYACVDRGMVRLTAENGIEATNVIFLEPSVVDALLGWMKRHGVRS